MPKVFSSESQKLGKIGEDVACNFLKNKGFLILEQNYTKKWGELDIIAELNGNLHFIEVKSVSKKNINNVTYETGDYKPEDNIHPWKVKRLGRTMQTYLLERRVPESKNWQFDICSVYLDVINRVAKVVHHENIIL